MKFMLRLTNVLLLTSSRIWNCRTEIKERNICDRNISKNNQIALLKDPCIMYICKRVDVGTTANMLIQPWGAILLGTLAGIISVCGFYYVHVHSSHDAGHSKLKIVLLHA